MLHNITVILHNRQSDTILHNICHITQQTNKQIPVLINNKQIPVLINNKQIPVLINKYQYILIEQFTRFNKHNLT